MTGMPTQQTTSRAGDQPTDLGEWWQFRGNRTLTGRSALRGNIVKPAIQWRRFCGARETYLSLETYGSGVNAGAPNKDRQDTVDLPTADLQADQWQQMAIEWGIEGPWYDLDSNGTWQSI